MFQYTAPASCKYVTNETNGGRGGGVFHVRQGWIDYYLALCALLVLFLPSHSSRVLSGDGLAGGNPTMNTPRLRRGGGIACSSILWFYLFWYSYIVYFVCDSASEFGAMDSTSFLGFSCLNLLLVFRNLLCLGTCIIFFSQVLGLSLGLFFFL